MLLRSKCLRWLSRHCIALRAPGNCISDHCPNVFGHTSGDELAVHFWKSGLRHAKMLENSNSQTAGSIPFCHALWTKVMNIFSGCSGLRMWMDWMQQWEERVCYWERNRIMSVWWYIWWPRFVVQGKWWLASGLRQWLWQGMTAFIWAFALCGMQK